MVRSVVSKVMWVGRATVFLVGLAVILAVVLGVATTAVAHSGSAGLFHLDHNNNVATTFTKLTGNLAGQVLRIDNNGTGPALSLEVGNQSVPANDVAPMRVNSNKVVTNLNADKVDGEEASSFATQAGLSNEVGTRANADQNLQSSLDQEANTRSRADSTLSEQLATHKHAGEDITSGTVEADLIEDGSGSNLNADLLDGKDSTDFMTYNSSLKSGQTLVGVWGTAAGGGELGAATIEFRPMLPASIATSNAHYVTGGTHFNCPGQGRADPGHLCVYQTAVNSMDFSCFCDPSATGTGISRLGTIMYFNNTTSFDAAVRGTWAVRAP